MPRKSLGGSLCDSRPSCFPDLVTEMNTQQRPRRFTEIKFRVLVIGRANAGKTSILQRVCDTTESPVIYGRRKGSNGERVCCLSFVNSASLVSTPDQVQLDPSVEVSDIAPFVGYY
jgi:GTPase SAR1 family protein